jgi:hypothetical protein
VTTDRPSPEVLIFSGRNGSVLVVRLGKQLEEFDFDFITELPPMLLDKFDAATTGDILRQCRAHAEGWS